MFTRENLDKLHKLSDQIAEQRELSSELLRTAKDRHGERKHKLEREGQAIELHEKTMWYEVFQIGPDSQSGKILSKKHPQVFEAYRKQEKTADELKVFCIKELKMDYTQMGISDYIRLTESMFKLLLTEEGLKHNLPKYWMYKIKKALKK